MSHYEAVVDLSNRNSSHVLVVEMVGEGRTVLDVGCASGYLAEALNARGCKVSGIELDAEAAERARPQLEQLVVGDLEQTPLAEAFTGRAFERIVFGDVLEHLTDPVSVLRSALEILDDDGEVVVSIPNVAHASLRIALLAGRWKYTDTGLLDRTHLRFVTLDGLVTMLGEAGLVIQEAHSTVLDPRQSEVEFAGDELPEGLVEWVRDQPHALDYQFVVRARRGEPTGALPHVNPAVPYAEARLDDNHAHRARELAERQHQVLVQRDYVVGLEAQVGRANVEVAAVRREAEHTVAELQRTVNDLIHDRAAMRGSTTWRLGSLVTAPLSALKRGAK